MQLERKFTLRISDEETQALNRLKEELGEKTDTAVIKRIIHSYESLNNRYNDLMKKHKEMESSFREKDRKITNFVNALKDLDSL